MLTHILHAAFSLLMIVTPQPMGAIHILIEPGNEILLDARSVGFSSEASSGMMLDPVPAGEHDLVIKTPEGAHSALRVRVSDGEITTLTISSIGMRATHRGEESTLELNAVSASRRCELIAGSTKMAGNKDDLRIEHLSPGEQRVTVYCGARSASSLIDIPGGMIVTVTADFDSGRVRVVNQRQRVTTVSVANPEDAIMHLDLPLKWRRAIATSLVEGVHSEGITREGNLEVNASFSAAQWDMLDTFINRLRHHDNVASVDAVRSRWSNGPVVRLKITFRTE